MEWALLRHTEVVGKRGWGITVPSRERTQAPGLPAKVTDWQVHSGSGASSYAPVNPVGFGLPPGGLRKPGGCDRHGGWPRGQGHHCHPGTCQDAGLWPLLLMRSPGWSSNGSEALRLILTNAKNPA